jgi:hypothetical protein
MISNHILILKRYSCISLRILTYPYISYHILRYPRGRTPRCCLLPRTLGRLIVYVIGAPYRVGARVAPSFPLRSAVPIVPAGVMTRLYCLPPARYRRLCFTLHSTAWFVQVIECPTPDCRVAMHEIESPLVDGCRGRGFDFICS